MGAYVLRRLAQALVLLWGISLLVFLLVHTAPGDPTAFFVSEAEPDPAVREAVRRQLGLDRPLYVQYVRWVGRAARGDLGISFRYQAPVRQLIAERLPATVQLQLLAIAVAVAVALPVGVFSALHSRSPVERLVTAASLVGISVPEFWSALMLILLFSLSLGWLPSFGMGAGLPLGERARHYLLPTVILALTYTAWYTRFVKTSTLEVIREDYVRTAVAKGLRRRTVVFRHVLRNALIPVVTVIGLSLPRLLGGSIIVESIFSWPGIGRLGLEAVLKRDYPVIMGLTIVTAVGVLVINLLIDILYVLLDPRVSFEGRR